jgi:hypothetical protein
MERSPPLPINSFTYLHQTQQVINQSLKQLNECTKKNNL